MCWCFYGEVPLAIFIHCWTVLSWSRLKKTTSEVDVEHSLNKQDLRRPLPASPHVYMRTTSAATNLAFVPTHGSNSWSARDAMIPGLRCARTTRRERAWCLRQWRRVSCVVSSWARRDSWLKGGSWQRGIRGSPTSPCSKTMLGDNEDRQPAEESPADEKVSVIVPWISSNRSAVDLVMVLR